jgi:serine O-acetyltransferase
VIGETAVVGDNCSLLHGVTLGGSGNEQGDRHPKIGCGVMIGAGAKILGNIKVGDCARIAAGSVVLKDVPPQAQIFTPGGDSRLSLTSGVLPIVSSMLS